MVAAAARISLHDDSRGFEMDRGGGAAGTRATGGGLTNSDTAAVVPGVPLKTWASCCLQIATKHVRKIGYYESIRDDSP